LVQTIILVGSLVDNSLNAELEVSRPSLVA
jgi:hypothetical protein